MIAPLTGLTLVILGVIALEAAAPRPGPPPEAVADVPPLAVSEEPRSCTRSDEVMIEEIRALHRDATGRVTSSQIYACPVAFDRTPVAYAGEVIGDLLRRDDGVWAQINDDDYALEVGPLVGHRALDGFNSGLSVWLPGGLHEEIEHVGRPGRRGDVVLVEGTLLQADPADGGGITLRADRLEVLEPSVEVHDPLHVLQAIVAAVLAVLAAAIFAWSRRSR